MIVATMRGTSGKPSLRVARSRRRARRAASACRSRAAAASSRRTRRARRPAAARCRASVRGPCSRKRCGVAAIGKGPWPQITSGALAPARITMAGSSPPGPLRCGSTICSTKPAAHAASNALPPRSSTAMPVWRREPVRGRDRAERAADIRACGESRSHAAKPSCAARPAIAHLDKGGLPISHRSP